MDMKKHPNKVEYFTKKLAARKPEIERKNVKISWSNVETRFKQRDVIEVFRGSVKSFYFDVDARTIVEEFLLPFPPEKMRFGSSGSFIRLREMVDDDGAEMYFKETRLGITALELSEISSITLSGTFFDEDHMRANLRGAKYTKDYGVVLNKSGFYELRQEYLRNRVLKEIEEKRRLACVLPVLESFAIVDDESCKYVPGLEFSLDHVLKAYAPRMSNEISIDPYLEIETESIEKYLAGVRALGFSLEDFESVGSRTLIMRVRSRGLS